MEEIATVMRPGLHAMLPHRNAQSPSCGPRILAGRALLPHVPLHPRLTDSPPGRRQSAARDGPHRAWTNDQLPEPTSLLLPVLLAEDTSN